MNKKCEDCQGKGFWQDAQMHDDCTVTVYRECRTCGATGISSDPEDTEDFDFGDDKNE